MIINKNHPSFGANQAYFMFGIIDNGAYCRTVLVEAKNPWAVQVIERIAIKEQVSEKCFLLAVFIDSHNVGMRHNSCDEISYVDFMLDMVDSDLILSESAVAHAFQRSLSAEDVAYAKSKMNGAWFNQDKPKSKMKLDETVSQSFDDEKEFDGSKTEVYGPYTTAMSALVGLGYKKPQAKVALDKIGINIFNLELNDIIKTALRNLQVA